MTEEKKDDIISKRRTFAIISHPDAGKTTLTEKLLLFGGAIQMAGAVKAKKEQRAARSDWMKVEQERGISVASSVMTFEYKGCTFNLLDTPGHEDFSEDTYRVLTAVDSAVMVIDCAKGIEAQTLKLFEVCRLRDIPIITFINKLDRDGQDPFALLEEIEQSLALDVTPASWPIGMGRDFKGCYDLLNDKLLLLDKTNKTTLSEPVLTADGILDEKIDALLGQNDATQLRENVEMAKALCKPFDLNSYLEGHMTPVFFGSAINNFGVQELLDGLVKYAPAPRAQKTPARTVEPTEDKVSGFIFKIQANMDPKHRDRIAFMRICSGHFKNGMKLYHVRSEKQLLLHNPVLFLAQDRELASEAWAGDIMGVPNHGNLRIGDTLTEGEKFSFTGIPSFAPELLQKVRPVDPLKAKHLGKALMQIAEEGGASVFKPLIGADWIVGVVGALQFQILADRIRTEYDVPVIFEQTSFMTARWLKGNPNDIKNFVDKNRANAAQDHDENWVLLARNDWHLNKTAEDFPKIKFIKTKQN
ncbi:MAG: peptide chain release factor 3 [Alphaproteobacteria bacterium]|nr:peptide chain release factor 3 [Alphaproteobacteria bacterium]